MHQKKHIAIAINRNMYIFWALISLIVVSIFMYAYFVNATIFHTAQRQQIEDTLVDTKSKVSQLELALIESNRNVTRSYAHALGFTDTRDLVFVERDSTVSISLHEIER
jgi:hypothetical protein